MKKIQLLLTLLALVLAVGMLTLSCGESGIETGETILNPIQPLIVATAPTNSIGGASEQKLAQTIIINHSGILTGVFLPLDCSSGDLNVEIRNVTGSLPDMRVVSSNSFPADSLITDVTVFKLFQLPASTVTSGDSLAVVLSNETGTCGMSSGPIGDPYAGGEAFFDARPAAPGWVPFTEFDSTAHDLAFQILLEDI